MMQTTEAAKNEKVHKMKIQGDDTSKAGKLYNEPIGISSNGKHVFIFAKDPGVRNILIKVETNAPLIFGAFVNAEISKGKSPADAVGDAADREMCDALCFDNTENHKIIKW